MAGELDRAMADRPAASLRAFHWTHLLAGASCEIVTLVVVDTAANEVLAVLGRRGGRLDAVVEADVRRGLADNAELHAGGRYAGLADDL